MRRLLSAALVVVAATVAACIHGPVVAYPPQADSGSALAPVKYGDSILHGGLHYVTTNSPGILAGSGTSSSPLTATVHVDGTTITGTGSAGDPLVGAGGGLSGGVTGDLVDWASPTTVGNYAGSTCAAGTVATALGSTGALTCGITPITNGAGANAVVKSNGTNLVASQVTDDGTVIEQGTSGPYFLPATPELGVGYGTNAAATLFINHNGYSGSTTQFRNLEIDNGKGASALSITGSDKSATFGGDIRMSTSTTLQTNTNGMSCFYGAASTQTCLIDSVGYLDGTTQYRDLQIDDGKGHEVAYFTGSTLAAKFDGPATVIGNALLENGLVYVDANGLAGAFSTNGTASLSINFDGYNGGTTQKRNMVVYDGEGGQIGLWDGTNEELHVTGTGGTVVDKSLTVGVHDLNSASAPTGSGCTPGSGSTDNGGLVTMATASTTTCTVTFASPWPNSNVFCACSNATTGTTEALDDCEANSTTLTIHATAATSAGVFAYVCTGHT